MSLLELKNIGKIYASGGNVAVGIRNVNLSFDAGEFVAVTGKSGSGKSTLLNVLSGMDSYEEGELYIEGSPTSHYAEEDWETYRSRYISFIFQDYNIIESFTVLQNVELALLHMENPRERRKRALELLRRVGLSKQIHQKGSKLSGGQKQRTVIARALAKDSPIILADEPTGNLDSATSAEIIKLLAEVSKDKLLIMVTHNFDRVENYATRHVRIFDGSVEFDHRLKKTEKREYVPTIQEKKEKYTDLKNGITLGKATFFAKPRLSVFLCLLLLLGTASIFAVTSFCKGAGDLFKKETMFTHIDGRVVLTHQNGEPMTEDELQKLTKTVGAQRYLHDDHLLDSEMENAFSADLPSKGWETGISAKYTYSEYFGAPNVGRYPTEENEVFLYAPISRMPDFGEDELKITRVSVFGISYRLTGVKYYYDNNNPAKLLFTKEGFQTATNIATLSNASTAVAVSFGNSKTRLYLDSITPSFEIPSDSAVIQSKEYDSAVKTDGLTNPTVDIGFSVYSYNYDYFYDMVTTNEFRYSVTEDQLVTAPENLSVPTWKNTLILGIGFINRMMEERSESSYRQASLFFANDQEASAALETLNNSGYIAVLSSATYSPNPLTVIVNTLKSIGSLLILVLTILFLTFFLSLCSGRAVESFRGDLAIMRSMGIPVKTVRVGLYARMLISLIPAYVGVAILAFLIFTVPKFNAMFSYLYFWQYAVIFAGMLILTLRVTKKQVKKLFGGSVKASIRGGDAA